MYWQEKKSEKFVISREVVDFAFRIDCRALPLDHSYTLAQQLLRIAPWLEDEPQAGVHSIHVAASGNGWQRPEDDEHELLQVSKRTRLSIRIPGHRIDDAKALTGAVLDIDGHRLELGKGQVKLLSDATTVFSRRVVCLENETEDAFLERQAQELRAQGIHVSKMLCGRSGRIRTPDGVINTRTLMLADLTMQESVRLQQTGIGPMRLIGCGLVLPHKGIAPVVAED